MKINSINFYNYKQNVYPQNNISRSNVAFCSGSVMQSDLDKLYSIMPKEQLNKEFNDICKNLKLDINPKLEIVDSYNDGRGGGYNFYRHEVSLCASDLVCSDYKIVGTKAGKKIVLVDPKTQSPLFATKDMAEEFVKNAQVRKNYGYDSIEMVPTTIDDKKRLIIQKLSHELIHAQQHMLMRQTEGIGEKEIIKAWTHGKPRNSEEEKQLNNFVEKSFAHSFWADKKKTEIKIPKNSPAAMLTYQWLNAVKNYPPVNSVEYLTNAIETDAYRRSADYAQNMFGQLKA